MMDFEEEKEFEFQQRETLFGACEENCNLTDTFYAHNTVEEFLCNKSVRILVFPTTGQQPRETLLFEFDLDGFIIQMNTLIRVGLHYLFVGTNLQHHLHSLKKHLPLADYSAAGVSVLTKTYGHILGYIDGGYQLSVSCITAERSHPHPVFQLEVSARANATHVINSVFGVFAKKHKVLPPTEMQRCSIVKTNLNNLGLMNVLHQAFLLMLISRQVDSQGCCAALLWPGSFLSVVISEASQCSS